MERYPITSRFLSEESFRERVHLGLDFAMSKNTPLRTIQDGVIERVVKMHEVSGNAVYVKWADGKTALYAHMDSVSVQVGDRVKIGDLLGYSGNTGNVFGENGGYHLHFAIKDGLGRWIDPDPYAPFIQAMNHDLINTIASSGNGLITIENNVIEAIHFTASNFVNVLEGLDVNMIVSALFNSSPFT